MKHVSVIWENVKFPIGLGTLISIVRDETLITLDIFPGMLSYKGNTRTLEYYSYSNSNELKETKRVIAIVSLWINKLPDVIKIP